jgi:dienelactone hydrolase
MRCWLSATLLVLIGATAVPVHLAAGAQSGSGGSNFTGPAPPSGFGVGEIVVTYTDPSRHVFIVGRGSVPRQLVTLIRYPTANPSLLDALGAPPDRAAGLFPLVVFAHGYDITPAPYAALLRAWVRAGYVVAAPIFPLTNPGAPGGPDESDLVNQPGDMSLVISRILAGDSAGHGILSHLIDPGQVAVTGQSDGGSTALAVAYNEHDLDPRIDAAMILSGAMIPGLRDYDFTGPSPPLLAVQGTADTVNAPASTYRFFRRARQPKFLLSLLRAPHLGPYTTEQPQLGIVERVTVAFLDYFLKHRPSAATQMVQAGNVPRLATLSG